MTRTFSFLIALVSLAQALPVHQAQAANSEFMVDKVIFHAGNKSILLGNVRAGTVPEDAWHRFIMGEETTWALPPHRRGLYGTQDLWTTSPYGMMQIEKGRKNWVMAIHIKDECRKPKHFDIGGYGLKIGAESSRPGWCELSKYKHAWCEFKTWYQDRREKYADLESVCAIEGVEGNVDWFTGVNFEAGHLASSVVDRMKTCTPVILDFMKDEEKWVVADQAMRENSYFIRERSCIENILGTPDDLFKMLVLKPISAGEGTDPLIGETDNTFYEPVAQLVLFMQVLGETTLLTPANRPIINERIKEWMDEDHPAGLNLIVKDPSDRPVSRSGSYKVAFELTRLASKCIKAKKVEPFQKLLNQSVDEFVSRYQSAVANQDAKSRNFNMNKFFDSLLAKANVTCAIK